MRDSKKALKNNWFSFLGGFLGFWFGCLPIVLYYDVSILRFSDALLLGLPFSHFFGRLACINQGCCSGKVKNSEKGIYFSYNKSFNRAVDFYGLKNRRIVPVHLYEMGLNFFLGLVLLLILFLVPEHGWISMTYFFGYGLIRLGLDPLRAEEKKFLFNKYSLYLVLLVLIFFIFGFCYFCAVLNNNVLVTINWNSQYLFNIFYLLPLIFIMSLIAFFCFGFQKIYLKNLG